MANQIINQQFFEPLASALWAHGSKKLANGPAPEGSLDMGPKGGVWVCITNDSRTGQGFVCGAGDDPDYLCRVCLRQDATDERVRKLAMDTGFEYSDLAALRDSTLEAVAA